MQKKDNENQKGRKSQRDTTSNIKTPWRQQNHRIYTFII